MFINLVCCLKLWVISYTLILQQWQPTTFVVQHDSHLHAVLYLVIVLGCRMSFLFCPGYFHNGILLHVFRSKMESDTILHCNYAHVIVLTILGLHV